MLCSSRASTHLARQRMHARSHPGRCTAEMVQSSLPTATGCSSVASPRVRQLKSSWVHPNGTGLYRLTYAPDDVHYEGSSFSPEFKGWGDIVAVRWPAYGDYDNSDVFRMHIEASDVQSEVTVNLTKSQNLDDAPSWGTYPPSARQ